jgi:hypothetical protein
MPAVRVADRDELITVLPTAVFLVTGTEHWHRTLLAGHLSGRLTGYPDGDLADLTAGAINALAREHRLDRDAAPASSVGILRWTGDTVTALVIGATPVTVFTGGGPEPLTSPELAVGADPDVAYEARLANWPQADVHAALLADGTVPSWPDALNQASADGPETVLDDLTALAVVTF